MLNRIIGIFVLVHFAVTAIIFFPIGLVVWLLTLPFDKKQKVLHLFTSFWGAYYTYTFPAWRIKITGRKKINQDATYLMVSNHQSLLDILVYFRIYTHFKWVSKEEVFKIPLVGWTMRMNRYIALKRGFRSSLIRMMKDCLKRLEKGNSVFMFPEGTRSEDGRIKPFQAGAFVLAKKAKVNILPMVIIGTHDALPKKSLDFHIKKQMIEVKVLEEMKYDEFKDLSDEEIATIARDQIVKEFDKGYSKFQ